MQHLVTALLTAGSCIFAYHSRVRAQAAFKIKTWEYLELYKVTCRGHLMLGGLLVPIWIEKPPLMLHLAPVADRNGVAQILIEYQNLLRMEGWVSDNYIFGRKTPNMHYFFACNFDHKLAGQANLDDTILNLILDFLGYQLSLEAVVELLISRHPTALSLPDYLSSKHIRTRTHAVYSRHGVNRGLAAQSVTWSSFEATYQNDSPQQYF